MTEKDKKVPAVGTEEFAKLNREYIRLLNPNWRKIDDGSEKEHQDREKKVLSILTECKDDLSKRLIELLKLIPSLDVEYENLLTRIDDPQKIVDATIAFFSHGKPRGGLTEIKKHEIKRSKNVYSHLLSLNNRHLS